MKKIFKYLLLVVFVALIVWTFVFLWQKSSTKPDVFELVTPSIQSLEKKTLATGTLEPRDEVQIKPQINGIISKLYKEAGEKVKVGDVLAKVKVIPEMGQLNSAEAQLRQAKLNLDQIKRDFERTKALFDRKVVSNEDYEKAETEYKKAEEDAQSAQDNLEIVRDGIAQRSAQYSNTQIRSTIAGTILDVPVKEGNSVIQSNSFNDGTTIATIADMGDMIFKGKLDETEVGRVHENMNILLSIGALQSMKFDAVLEYISPKSVEENGAILFEIKAAAHIPDTVQVRAGYSANAEIILDSRKDVIAIPESTIEFKNDSTFVYVLTVESPIQEFERRQVKLGLSDGMNVEICEGLKVEEKIRGNKIKE